MNFHRLRQVSTCQSGGLLFGHVFIKQWLPGTLGVADGYAMLKGDLQTVDCIDILISWKWVGYIDRQVPTQKDMVCSLVEKDCRPDNSLRRLIYNYRRQKCKSFGDKITLVKKYPQNNDCYYSQEIPVYLKSIIL